MKNKITGIAYSIREFVKAVAALVCVALLFSLLLFLAISAVVGALWCVDLLFLGGGIFG